MKEILLSIFAVAALLPTVAQPTGFSFDLPIEPIKIRQELFERNYAEHNGVCNWTFPRPIARAASGDSISMGYDLNYLMHFLLDGDSIIAHDISLLLDHAEVTDNKGTFIRSNGRRLDVDFADPNLAGKLHAFLAPPPGYHTETYSFGIAYSPEANNIDIDYRRTFAAELPDDPAARQEMLRLIAADPHYQIVPGMYQGHSAPASETVGITDLKEYSRRYARNLAATFLDSPCTFYSLPPTSYSPRFGSMTDVVQWLVALDTPELLTIATTINSAYIAGDGTAAENYSRTYSKADGALLTPADIFQEKYIDEVKQAFINAVSEEMIDEEIRWNEGIAVDSFSPEAILPIFCGETYGTDEDRLGEYSVADFDLPDVVGLTAEGVLFSYPGEIFTRFGETGYYNQLLPYSRIKKYLTPKVKKALKRYI